MSIIRKYLMISAVGAIGAMGVIFLLKNMMFRHHPGAYEKAGKNFDERLMQSKLALDQATDHIRNAFEHIKNRKA